jgi:NAD(P)-dependent dehydrogenase (short-subunit alcohol dehydrogenase family)
MGQFEGKVALVTGAGSGVGRASVLAFARHGASVVVSDISAEGGDETIELIQAAGGEAVFIATDVTSAAEVERLVDGVIDRHGRLDYAQQQQRVPVLG